VNLGIGTSAFMLGIGKIPARTRIHGSDQHKTGRIRQGHGCPGYGNLKILQRLPENLYYMFFKFGEFVQKEDAVMRQADLSGSRDMPAADESGIGYGMMG